jgi:hypothetical protein
MKIRHRSRVCVEAAIGWLFILDQQAHANRSLAAEWFASQRCYDFTQWCQLFGLHEFKFIHEVIEVLECRIYIRLFAQASQN